MIATSLLGTAITLATSVTGPRPGDLRPLQPERCHRCRRLGPQHAARTVVRTTRRGHAREEIVCDVAGDR